MPLRKGRKPSATPSSQFLFVNEDAATLNRSGKDAELDREKQSHVQRQNFAKRRLQKEKAQATPDVPLDAIQQSSPRSSKGTPAASLTGPFPDLNFEPLEPSLPELTDADIWLADFNAPSTTLDLRFRTANTPGQQSSFALDLTLKDIPVSWGHIQTQLTQTATRTALSNPLRSSLPHPLFAESGPVPSLSEWAPPLMRYYTTVLLREIFFHDTRLLPLSRLRHAPAVHEEMNDAMSHPAHLYSLLASVAIQMVRREGRLLTASSDGASDTVSRADCMRIILFFKTRAIEALRAALDSGPVTHKLVADVQRLMLVAYFSDAHEAAWPHFEAMNSMIGFLGGLSTFSDYFVETKILMHWAANIPRLTNPQVCMKWDPGPGPEDIRSITGLLRRTTMNHATRGFASLTSAGILSPRIQELAEDLADVLRFERYIYALAQNNPQTSNPDHFKWAFRRHIAIGYHLLGVDPYTTTSTGTSTSTSSTHSLATAATTYDVRNEAIRIATIFFTGLSRSPNRGQRCGSQAVHRLREVLLSDPHLLSKKWNCFSLPPYTHTHARPSAAGPGDTSSAPASATASVSSSALLWVAIIGALTARAPGAEYEWFVDLASSCAIYLGVSSIEDLEDRLGEFLYEPELQRGRLFGLWAKMRERGVARVSVSVGNAKKKREEGVMATTRVWK